MSVTRDDGAADQATPHELVRHLEASMAARLAAADEARDEVARAQVQADHLIADAEVHAAESARRRTAVILSAARAEAARLTDAGNRTAADLTALAARRRDDDVAAVVSSVLPERVASTWEGANRR